MSFCEVYNNLGTKDPTDTDIRLGDRQKGDEPISDWQLLVIHPDECKYLNVTEDSAGYLVFQPTCFILDNEHKMILYNGFKKIECFKVTLSES